MSPKALSSNEPLKLRNVVLNSRKHRSILVQMNESLQMMKTLQSELSSLFNVITHIAMIVRLDESIPGVMNAEVRFFIEVVHRLAGAACRPPICVILSSFKSNHTCHALSRPAADWTLLVQQEHLILAHLVNEVSENLEILDASLLVYAQDVERKKSGRRFGKQKEFL